MRRLLVDLVTAAALAAAPLGAVLALRPGWRELALDLYVLFVGGLALYGALAATREAGGAGAPHAFERALAPASAGSERLPELARLEREVVLAQSSSFDVHSRLRPALRDVASDRLWRHRGIELDRSPEARPALGEELWEFVRPGREPPSNRHARGLSLPELERLVETLERL